MFLNRDLSKEYLAGNLTPKENYQIEDKLLEDDFGYLAFEGLEQLPSDQWQRHLEHTESRIIEEFGIDSNKGIKRRVTLGVAGLVAALMVSWYFFSPSQDPIDLSSNQVEISSEPSVDKSEQTPLVDTLAQISPIEEEIEEEPMAKPEKKEPVKPPPTIPKNVKTHITVGRIVDIKGIPVVQAIVTSGKATDTTDKSGYYALKVAKGGIKVSVSHLATPYVVEIDSQQNWEIVLDIAQRKVQDYYPMNAANRFK